MSLISTDPVTVPKPQTVSIAELAVAAGLAGQPVAVCMLETAAAIDCQLFNYLAEFAGPCIHIHDLRDVGRLKNDVGDWRFVVIHNLRLMNAVAWTVRSHAPDSTSRPAIFCRALPDVIDDVPIPLLVLRTTPDESSAVLRWLSADCPERAFLHSEPPNDGIVYDPRLVGAIQPMRQKNVHESRQLRDRNIIKALLAGASLIETERNFESTAAPKCGQKEYEQVRQLLQSPLLCTDKRAVTALALDMVGRTNVLLELKRNDKAIAGSWLFTEDGDPSWNIRGHRTGRDLTTRREVADLGNTGGRLIREILAILPTIRDGFEMFQRMGLVRGMRDDKVFHSGDWYSLARMLRPWSFNQVRTHFDALRKAGLISGERDSDNSPWQYGLPEELTITTLPFRTLPFAEQLFAENGTSRALQSARTC